jgi:hypothetical protein
MIVHGSSSVAKKYQGSIVDRIVPGLMAGSCMARVHIQAAIRNC